MKIVVLIKQVPDTYEERRLDPSTGILDRESAEAVFDEINERALEVALKQKDRDKSTEIVVASMGPASAAQALRKALTMGADSGLHILDERLATADAQLTSTALAAALRTLNFDLVIAGNESTDGAAGVVPAMVAEKLGVPLLGQLASLTLEAGSAHGQRHTADRVLALRAPLPAVVTVTELFDDARFPNFKGILSAKRKPVVTMTAAELGLDDAVVAAHGATQIVAVAASAGRAAGVKIIDDGSGADALVEFLATQKLI